MKQAILKLLREDNQIFSGEALSARLGTTRVSIWKHIQGLKKAGYEIEATAKGYCLKESPDIPFPWECGLREKWVHYYDSVPSTMDVAREKARQGAPGMSVVVAGSQTGGRGRLKRVWRSDEGGLYFTLILRPDVTPQASGRIVLYAATIWPKVLKSLFGIEAGVKWPNDILINEKKVAGLLAEMETDFDQVSHLNIGIGINVNNDPFTREPGATSIKNEFRRCVSIKDLLIAYLDAFEADFKIAGSVSVIYEWKKQTVTLGRQVKVVTPRSVTIGIAEDVDDHGGLIIRKPDGSRQTAVYGDCFHNDLE